MLTGLYVLRFGAHASEVSRGELMVFWATIGLVIVTIFLTAATAWVGLVEIRKARADDHKFEALFQAENNRHLEKVVGDVADVATVKIQNKP